MDNQHCAWYHDETEGTEVYSELLGYNPDGDRLVWLCDQCAEEMENEGKVSFAGEDSLYDCDCWRCSLPHDWEREDIQLEEETDDLSPLLGW
jgi:hypothetical protein